jgi:hypothetical protein
MSGQIQKISANFTIGDTDFVFQIADGQATLALPAKDVRLERTTAEWLIVTNTVCLLDSTPRQSDARGPNVDPRWTPKMDAVFFLMFFNGPTSARHLTALQRCWTSLNMT